MLAEGLTAIGFQKKGRRTFYLRIDDILTVISFERPSGLLYLQFALIPLYLPCGGEVYYDYGSRFHNMFSDCPVLDRKASDQEIRLLCMSAIIHVKDDLLPFARSLSTAEKLISFSESAAGSIKRRHTRYIRCTPEKIKYLFMYSSIYAEDYVKARKAAKDYVQSIDTCSYLTEKLRDERKSEGESIVVLLETGQYSELKERLNRTVSANLMMFDLL